MARRAAATSAGGNDRRGNAIGLDFDPSIHIRADRDKTTEEGSRSHLPLPRCPEEPFLPAFQMAGPAMPEKPKDCPTPWWLKEPPN